MAKLGVTCEPARLGNHRIATDSDRGLPPGLNPFGRPIEPCNGCGFCTVGCIFNAAQTLQHNYLAQAEDSGHLSLRTDALAWTIEPLAGGYRAHWYDYRSGRWSHDDGLAVVAAAGAINTPELLLRCRDMERTLPDLSAWVGRNLSVNGYAAFSVLFASLPSDFKAETFKGQVSSIVSYHWWRSHRFVIEDAGTAPLGVARFPVRQEGGDERYWGPQVKSLLRSYYATDMLGLAGSGIDSPDGRVDIDRNGHATVQWTTALGPGDRTFDLVQAIREASGAIARAGGGELLHDKDWTDNRRLVSVHPVGGCRMATSIGEGVVNADGAVFGHPGLFVVDGSILPGAVG